MSTPNHGLNKKNELEKWLQILINTYQDFPSDSLAKVICYYIERIINSDDAFLNNQQQQDYFVMRRFWLWQSTNRH